MTKNIDEVSAEINAEDELVVADESKAFEEGDSADEKELEAEAKRVGYDSSFEPGYQQSLLAAEFGLRRAHRMQTASGEKCNYVHSSTVYGELHDKVSAGLHVYTNNIVAHFQSDLTTSERGYTICPFFAAVGQFLDPATGEETLRLEFRDRFQSIRRVDIRRSLIAEGAKRLAPHLAAHGFSVPSGSKMREYLVTLLDDLQPPRAHRPTTTGWLPLNDQMVFATPKELIGDVAGLRIVQSTPANVKIGKRGTNEGWRNSVLRYSSGNTRLQLGLALAFASPLLRFVPWITPLGVHFFGESSSGKTTTAAVAGSVWGGSLSDPLGYAHSWHATANYTMSNASAHSGTLFALDEMGTADGVDRIVYGLANGQERGRLNKDGDQRSTSKISVFTISTGEQSLEEKLRSSNPKSATFAGVEARFVSMPVDAGKGFGGFDVVPKAGAAYLAQSIQEDVREHFGHAGPLFVQKLINFANAAAKECDADEADWSDADFPPTSPDYAMARVLQARIKQFVDRLNLDPKADAAVVRAARGLGLIEVAGRLACEFGILPLGAEEVGASVQKCTLDWIASRGGASSKTTSTVLVALRNYVNANEPRFQLIGGTDGGNRPINPVGFKEVSKAGNVTYYMLPGAWNEVQASAPRGKLAEELIRLDLLARPASSEGTRTFQTLKRIDANTRVRVYAVDGAVRELTDHGTLEPSSEVGSKKNVVDLRTRRAIEVLRGAEVA